MNLTAEQTDEILLCRLFGYNKWASVKGILHGRLTFAHLIMR